MNNRFSIIKQYLKYQIKAKGSHSIHSPFVFELYKNCIHNTSCPDSLKKIETQRKKISEDNRVLHITDRGTGKDRDSRLGDLVKKSSKSQKQSRLLYRIAHYFNPDSIIELGTAEGFSTMYFATACPDKKIISIEGCPQRAEVAESNFRELSIKNIQLLLGDFDEILPGIQYRTNQSSLIFIDGNHTKEGTLRYFDFFVSRINTQSVIIIDDINWSDGMRKAWSAIKMHPDVTVSVDLFFAGIVFFRKDLSKQDFILRF